MVGNYVPPESKIGYRKDEIVFAWIPRKTDKGWRWLCKIKRITENVRDEKGLSRFMGFLGIGYLVDQQVRYEVLHKGSET